MSEALNTTLLELHAGCRRQSIDDFKLWALELANALVPFDSANWANAVVADGMTHTFGFSSIGLDSDFNRRMSEHSKLDKRMLDAYSRLGETLIRDSHDPDEVTPEFKRIVLDPANVRYAAMTMFMDEITSVIDGIVLMRAPAGTQFSKDEHLLIQALVPHLHQTRIANQIERSCDDIFTDSRASYYILVSNNEGLVIASEDAASAKLLQQWPDWSGGLLPDTLTNAIKQANGEQAAVRLASDKVVAWLHPNPMKNQTLIRLREPNEIDTLGQRERTVAEQFAAGFTYKQIAKSVGSSPSTVSNQLSSIYAKLDISSKNELARKFEYWR